MSSPKPKWWLLYALLPIMAALLALDHLLNVPEPIHQIVEILILVLIFGLMALWVVANGAALSHDSEKIDPRSIEVIVYDPRKAENTQRRHKVLK